MAWENDAPRLGLASMRRSAPRAAKAARLQPASQPEQPARRQRRRRGGPGSTAGLAVRGLQLAARGSRSRWVGGWLPLEHGSAAASLRLLALRRRRWALSDQIRKVRSKCIGDRRRERGASQYILSLLRSCSNALRCPPSVISPSSPAGRPDAPPSLLPASLQPQIPPLLPLPVDLPLPRAAWVRRAMFGGGRGHVS